MADPQIIGASVFGFFEKRPSSSLRVMGHDVNVVSITRDAEVLYTGAIVRTYAKDRLEGQILEISFGTRSGNPYFVYYLCPDYYFAVALPSGAASFGGPQKTEEFRSAVSQQIALFLVQYLQNALQIDARADITSFSHNSANTNVLAYVASLSGWYPIQHNNTEGEDASEEKVAQVDSGTAMIADVIAVDYPSPEGID
jgi:hypothetical protein